MNQKNTEKLIREFPSLYRQFNLSPQHTCMCWGFECEDGWFDLIYDLSKKISKYENVEVVQVKEKFGTLRFYVNGGTLDIYDLIDSAERESTEICEICGDSGKLVVDGSWVFTRCEKHLGEG